MFLSVADPARSPSTRANGRSTTTSSSATLEKLDKVAVDEADREMLGNIKEGHGGLRPQRCTRCRRHAGRHDHPRRAANLAFTPAKDAIRDLDENVTKCTRAPNQDLRPPARRFARAMSSSAAAHVRDDAGRAGRLARDRLPARAQHPGRRDRRRRGPRVAQAGSRSTPPEELGRSSKRSRASATSVETRELKSKVENDTAICRTTSPSCRVVATASDGDLTVRAPCRPRAGTWPTRSTRCSSRSRSCSRWSAPRSGLPT